MTEAIANGTNIPISTKKTIEIANFIRGKNALAAQKLLQEVTEYKRAVPYTRFNKNIGHKPGMAAGRYPGKTAKYILELLNNAISNAEHKGIAKTNLRITSIIPNQGQTVWKYGRKKRRRAKRTNLTITVSEKK